MNLSQDVTEILNALVTGIQQTLKENLAGVYLRGSLVLGDFMPDTSDIDVLAVTERPVDEAEFAALANLHAEVAALSNPYATRLEIAYIDRAAFRRFQPGVRHPTLGQGAGESLVWMEHGANWILERWTVCERGVALLGPDPRTLIDPIASDELLPAVRARLPDWADWAKDVDDPGWQGHRNHMAYVVETMCRTLYMLVRGELASKQQAVKWGMQTLPEPWRATVERSQLWRTDSTVDPEIVPEVRALILWVAEYEPVAPGAAPDV